LAARAERGHQSARAPPVRECQLLTSTIGVVCRVDRHGMFRSRRARVAPPSQAAD
jgi:hypothetical protein